LSALLAGGALLGAGLPAASLDWQPGLALAQPWRWWTAAFVHLGDKHLAANLAGCAVVAAFGWFGRVPLRAAAAWFIAWPLGHLLLWLQPALTHYAGLSGVLHGGVAVAALLVAGSGAPRERAVGLLVLAGLLLKLLSEAPWRGATQAVAGWDFPVASIAHATGAWAGVLCVVALRGRKPAAR
jgi:rhomboid family GlyGly-CTERM serine protease